MTEQRFRFLPERERYMKKISKSIRTVFLVLCMVAAFLPVPVHAWDDTDIAYAVTGGNIYFSASDSTLTHADKTVTAAAIPSSVNGRTVTKIGSYAFSGCTSLKSVTFPSTLKTIDNSAFYDCDVLTSVSLPAGLATIGSDAFRGCDKLASVSLPSTLTSIGSYAFSGIPVTSITIPSGVTSLESGILSNCASLSKVTLPSGLTTIKDFAFGSSGLTSVTIPSSVKTIGINAFTHCSSLTSVSLSSGLETIGQSAFAYTGITSVTIPDTVTSIDKYAFEYCSSLTSVVLPKDLTAISNGLFNCCSGLKEIKIPKKVTSIGSYAFALNSALTDVTLYNQVTKISENAFSSCDRLSDVWYYGEKGEWDNIDISSTGNSKLLNATIHYLGPDPGDDPDPTPDPSDSFDVQVTGGYLHFDSQTGDLVSADKTVTNATIPSSVGGLSVKKIRDYAFYQCTKLTSVTFPSTLTSIGSSAFYDCDVLATAKIPEGVTSIGDDAFRGCDALGSVTLPSTLKTIGTYAFNGTIISSATIPSGVTSISSGAFSYCKSLRSVSLPSTLKEIGEFAFGESRLTYVSIPSSVTKIGERAFTNNDKLTSVTLNNGLTTIGSGAFSYTGLYNITIPDSVTSLGGYAFEHCAEMTEVKLPANITKLDNLMFNCCSKLNNVTIPEKVTEIGYQVFTVCTSLTDLTMYKNVTSIGDSSLPCMNGLTDIWFHGKRSEWNAIDISTVGHSRLSEVTIHCLEDETPETYTVTFNANGGTVTQTSKTVTYNSTYGTLPTPSRIGYSFAGWYTSSSGGSQVTSSTTVTTASNHTLYAHWTANTYTVTFNANGGSVSPTTKTVTYDSTYGTLPTPSNGDYEFAGWYTKTEGGTEVTSSTKVTTSLNHTLYAHWSAKTCTVTFDPNGGTVVTKTKTVAYNETYGTLPTPINLGYTFDGWYTSLSGGTQVTSSTTVTTESNHTLYAHWSPKSYTVTFDPAGGTVDETSRTVTYNTAYGMLPYPERTGYTFTGWFTEAEGGTQVTSTTKCTRYADHILYAQWSAVTVRVTFNGNEGTIPYRYKDVRYGEKYGKLPEAERLNYVFLGWTTEKNGNKYVREDDVVNTDQDHTLYAGWGQRKYEVTLDANGGTVSPGTVEVYDNGLYGDLPVPVRNGYQFSGWYTKQSGGKKIEADTVCVYDDQIYTLYAHWADTILERLSYSFTNGESNGGYSYRSTSLDTFKLMFGDTAYARTLYRRLCTNYNENGNENERKDFDGNCYGMSASAGLLYEEGNGISPADFNSSAEFAKDLGLSDSSRKFGISVKEFVEAMHISQYSYDIEKAAMTNTGIDKVIEAVSAFEKSGTRPPIISMIKDKTDFYGDGHAVIGYMVKDVSASEKRIYIYDNNYPLAERYITVTLNSLGKATDWSYEIGTLHGTWSGSAGGSIHVQSYEAYAKMWNNRGKNNVNPFSMFTVNQGNVRVMNDKGETMLEISNGRYTIYNDEVLPVWNLGPGTNGGTPAFWLPAGYYEVEKTDSSTGEIRMSLTDVLQSAAVQTAGTVAFTVDDTRSADVVYVYDANGRKTKYQIDLYSKLDNAYENVTLSGTTGEYGISFGQVDGQLYADGLEDTDGKEILKIDGRIVSTDIIEPEVPYIPSRVRDSGTCGDELFWEYDVDDQMRIYGRGDMYDYSKTNPAPWAKYVDSLDGVFVDEEVNSIGDYAFAGMNELAYFTSGSSLNKIGKYAFSDCPVLEDVELYEPLQEIGEGAFTNCPMLITVMLPGTIKMIGRNAYKNTPVDNVSFQATRYQWRAVNILPGNEAITNADVVWEREEFFPFAEYGERISGSTRYETSLQTAYALKQQFGVEYFDNVIIASGKSFADALAGSYLAWVKHAPILLVNDTEKVQDDVRAFIDENLGYNGMIYILGGTSAVSSAMESGFTGYQVKRLYGNDRYATNLKILDEAGIGNQAIIAASGKGFADSLSASAAKRPILLVSPKGLNNEQKTWLSRISKRKYYIAGGTSALDDTVRDQIRAYASSVERIAGANRYETSAKIAETFAGDTFTAVLACGNKYPDGLCGGVLAAAMDSPLILVSDERTSYGKNVLGKMNVHAGFVLGGTSAVSDKAAEKVLDVESIYEYFYPDYDEEE